MVAPIAVAGQDEKVFDLRFTLSGDSDIETASQLASAVLASLGLDTRRGIHATSWMKDVIEVDSTPSSEIGRFDSSGHMLGIEDWR